MLEIFIELTDQLYWKGYAQQLAIDNPVAFQFELAEFMDCYKS
ncbi:hypothetical protein ACFJIV_02360 [Mucilaginibacter sp. UC70_90]